MIPAAPPDRRRGRRVTTPDGPDGPWVLGFETGGDDLSVALWRLPAAPGAPPSAWRLVDETTSHRGHHNADAVLLMVDQLLWRHGLAPRDLGLVTAGLGPGGFTGVRVGLATAQGLALGLGAPLWPVPSLAALAQHAAGRGDALIVPLLDARRGEVYGAAFRVGPYGTHDTVLAPRVATCDSFLSAVREAADAHGAPPLVFGSGALTYGVASPVPPDWHRGVARHVAALGALAWDAAGRDAQAAPAVDPTYLRKSDAEIDQEARQAAAQARGGASDGL